MEIKKRRCGKIPRNVKRISEKETYFIEDIFSCSLYQISEMKLCPPKVKPFKFANVFTTNKIWQGGLYCTKGVRINIVDNKTLTECIVVIKESSNNYRRIDGQEFYIGYVPNSSKTSIYLFKNGNLYLMEKDYYPDMPQDSYRLLEEMCTIPSHIEVFNEIIKHENHQSKSTTELQFEEVDYQSLLYRDEDGNVIDNSIIPLSSVKESVKILTKNRKNKKRSNYLK